MNAKAILSGVAAVVSAVLFAPVAGAQAPATVKPLATVGTNWEGVSIDLMSVERKGSILTVKWAARNQGSKAADVQFGLTGRHQTTYAVDEESGTKYYVLTDKEKNSLACQHVYIGADTYGIGANIPPGGTGRCWMKLPAPPPQVKSISIFFTNAVEPIEGVAITDK